MQASVWPDRISTPPSLATSGNTWPGLTKSAAPLLPLASARTVLVRSSAEMPVVRPWRTSTVMVKAVPSGASLAVTIGSSRSRRASSPDSGAQTIPDVLRMMKAIFSGRAKRGRDEQIALVLAIVVVGDDDDLAAGKRRDCGFDTFMGLDHGYSSVHYFLKGQAGVSPTWARWRR